MTNRNVGLSARRRRGTRPTGPSRTGVLRYRRRDGGPRTLTARIELVARRRHLPDLPPQLRRHERRWGGGPARDHRPPRPSRRRAWARRRRDLALADLSIAGS